MHRILRTYKISKYLCSKIIVRKYEIPPLKYTFAIIDVFIVGMWVVFTTYHC